MAKGLLADIRPLRESPAYRRLWFGSSLSAIGSQMTTFAVALQVFRISHSSAAVGVVGIAYAVPAISVGLVGGVLIDSVDRRVLVLVTSTAQALISIAFAAQAFAGTGALWLLYVLTAAQGGVGAINAPARHTFMPRLLRRELIPAAAALTMTAMYIAMISGPALAGVIAAAGGLKLCYLIDAMTFGAALYGVFRLPPMRPEGEGSPRNLGSVVLRPMPCAAGSARLSSSWARRSSGQLPGRLGSHCVLSRHQCRHRGTRGRCRSGADRADVAGVSPLPACG